MQWWEAHLLDDGKNPGLRIVVAVGTDAEINLTLERIGLVGSDQAEQRIGGRERNSFEVGSHFRGDVGGDCV